MKKIVSLLLALVLVCSVVSTALAASPLLTLDRLQGIVDDEGYEVFKIDEEKNYIWVRLSDKDADKAVVLGLYIEGNSDNILNVFLLMDGAFAFSKSELDLAIATCNSWNTQKRWPTAYVNEDDLMFNGDNSLPCTEDVTDDMLREYIVRHFDACSEYLGFLYEAGFTQFSDYAK